jgi:hypothetical protein
VNERPHPPELNAFTLPRSDRRRLTPMTTASSVSDGGLEEGPNGRNSPPGSLDIASGQSLDPSPPSAQHPGAGRKSGIPQWEIRPLNVTAGVFSRPAPALTLIPVACSVASRVLEDAPKTRKELAPSALA